MVYNQQFEMMDGPDKTQMVAPLSLLKRVSVENEFSVWFCNQDKQLLRIDLSSGNLTVSQAIKESIWKLNKQFVLNLKDEVTCYQLFGAKKNGKKKTDFPPLQYQQSIQNTKLCRFHLFSIPTNRKHSEQSTLTSIQSSMEIENKSPRNQIQVKKGFGCFFCTLK